MHDTWLLAGSACTRQGKQQELTTAFYGAPIAI